MNKGKLISIIVLVVVLIGLVAYAATSMMSKDSDAMEQTEGEAVATVNGVDITREAYNAGLATSLEAFTVQGVDVENAENRAQIEAQVLEDLINNEVVNQALVASGVTATAEEVEAQYQNIVAQAGTDAEFKSQLAAANLTEASLRTNVLNQLSLQKFLQANIDVSAITATDAEVEALYKQAVDSGQEVPPLEEVEEQVRTQVVQNKQQQAVNAFVQALRAKADVKIMLEVSTA